MMHLIGLAFAVCVLVVILLKPKGSGASYTMLGMGGGLLAIAFALFFSVVEYDFHLKVGLHPYLAICIAMLLAFIGLVLSVAAIIVK